LISSFCRWFASFPFLIPKTESVSFGHKCRQTESYIIL
jgi:hypothetical protein